MRTPLLAVVAACVVAGGAALLLSAGAAAEDVPTPAVAAPPLDPQHAEFATALAAVVRADGVDYAALRRDGSALDRYRAQLARATEPQDRAALMALRINAYNACTLALVAAKLPEDPARWAAWSIRDAGRGLRSVWKSYTFELAGRRVTLDAIEHELLRPLGDPRIHMAINCASRSCPPLAARPYVAERLDAQLEAAATAFVRSAEHVRVQDGAVSINPILDWFAGDFAAGGGVRAFLQGRTEAGPLRDALAGGRPLRAFGYDWRPNLAGSCRD